MHGSSASEIATPTHWHCHGIVWRYWKSTMWKAHIWVDTTIRLYSEYVSDDEAWAIM